MVTNLSAREIHSNKNETLSIDFQGNNRCKTRARRVTDQILGLELKGYSSLHVSTAR